MSPAGLSPLPLELLDMIVSHIAPPAPYPPGPAWPTLCSLCCVSAQMRQVAQPYLYRRLPLFGDTDSFLDKGIHSYRITRLLRTIWQDDEDRLVSYVEEVSICLNIAMEIDAETRNWCLHLLQYLAETPASRVKHLIIEVNDPLWSWNRRGAAPVAGTAINWDRVPRRFKELLGAFAVVNPKSLTGRQGLKVLSVRSVSGFRLEDFFDAETLSRHPTVDDEDADDADEWADYDEENDNEENGNEEGDGEEGDGEETLVDGQEQLAVKKLIKGLELNNVVLNARRVNIEDLRATLSGLDSLHLERVCVTGSAVPTSSPSVATGTAVNQDGTGATSLREVVVRFDPAFDASTQYELWHNHDAASYSMDTLLGYGALTPRWSTDNSDGSPVNPGVSLLKRASGSIKKLELVTDVRGGLGWGEESVWEFAGNRYVVNRTDGQLRRETAEDVESTKVSCGFSINDFDFSSLETLTFTTTSCPPFPPSMFLVRGTDPQLRRLLHFKCLDFMFDVLSSPKVPRCSGPGVGRLSSLKTINIHLIRSADCASAIPLHDEVADPDYEIFAAYVLLEEASRHWARLEDIILSRRNAKSVADRAFAQLKRVNISFFWKTNEQGLSGFGRYFATSADCQRNQVPLQPLTESQRGEAYYQKYVQQPLAMDLGYDTKVDNSDAPEYVQGSSSQEPTLAQEPTPVQEPTLVELYRFRRPLPKAPEHNRPSFNPAVQVRGFSEHIARRRTCETLMPKLVQAGIEVTIENVFENPRQYD